MLPTRRSRSAPPSDILKVVLLYSYLANATRRPSRSLWRAVGFLILFVSWSVPKLIYRDIKRIWHTIRIMPLVQLGGLEPPTSCSTATSDLWSGLLFLTHPGINYSLRFNDLASICYPSLIAADRG